MLFIVKGMKLSTPLLSPAITLTITSTISVLALLAALASEAFLGLEPCPLCIYQRWPYLIAAVLGIAGLALRNNNTVLTGTTALSGLAFFSNSGIALYHSGIERHWWKSALEGCIVPNMSGEKQSILENIMSAPAARCDEIPWADPLLGLSMANYNVMLCLGLSAICALSIIYRKAKSV